MMEVKRRRIPVEVLVPASVASEEDHPMVTALRSALIARSLAIFRVDRISIYLDRFSKSCVRSQTMLQKHLNYMATPQYLRKLVFPEDESFRYAGIMPPLRSPSHTVPRSISQCKVGDLRIGLLVKRGGLQLVEAGLEQPLTIHGEVTRRGGLVLINILNPVDGICQIVDERKVEVYLNYDVIAPQKGLGKLLMERTECLRVGTSRLGTLIYAVEERLESKAKGSRGISVAFGSPKEGIHKILSREGCDCEDVLDFVVNTVPEQGVVTIRTEEALAISLALLNRTLS